MGRCVFSHGLRYMDRRCTTFQLTVSGIEHLRTAMTQPCLIVANHTIHHPENALFGRHTRKRGLRIFNWPADSFIFRRIVREETGLPLRVVARSDRGWWSPQPLRRRLQETIGQPFGRGKLEGMGYIPVEHNPGSFQRTFLESSARRVHAREPVMIFPGTLIWTDEGFRDMLLEGEVCPGAASLVRKFRLPILPAYLQGGEGWEAGRPARVSFGPAFRCDGLSKEEINRLIVERVQQLSTVLVESGP